MDYPTLEIKGLFCRLNGSAVLHDVSLHAGAGELLAITGHSGSGKTTLLRLISGLEQPDFGTIVINGRSAVKHTIIMPPHQRECSMVFQNLALWPHLTVQGHLHFILNKCRKDEQKERVTSILEQVRLLGKEDALPAHLSGGEQQRLAIARALINRPRLLLMDEPFSSLDFFLKQEMIRLLQILRQQFKVTVLYVSHSLEEIMQLADNVLVLNQGKVEFYGSKGDFASAHRDNLKAAVHWMQKEGKEEK